MPENCRDFQTASSQAYHAGSASEVAATVRLNGVGRVAFPVLCHR